ncbi:MAG TPA: class I SAM-dependent rRNA methyltransferase [Thermodesulfobacteriota bacterium]|nr:class I SAM-dependent rRNA methyltransferase [Thermodesulfobacteriota bacterium]
MPNFPKIILKKGREKPLLRGHPWVFSGAVERVEGEISPGDIGEVYSIGGEFLGIGHLNPRSQIFSRLLTSQKQEVGASFFRERIVDAFRLREQWLKGTTHAYRVVNGEGDFLPGLIVDRYGDMLVIQSLTAGMERLKGLFVKILIDEFHPKSIYERSDVVARKEEGLNETKGLVYGEDVRESVEIEEGDCRFSVNVKEGQKTGFYLDQRENRNRLREVSQGKHILDVCSYTGAFSVYAGLGGAREVTLIDSSQEALERAEVHFKRNRLDRIPRRLIRGDAFEVLRSLQPEFDIAILDPPPFAKKKEALPRASRGYKDLNLQAFRLLKREGLLFTFTCSHYMGWDLFQKVLFAAAVDAGKRVQFLSRMGHPVDHPVNLSHPEGEYLKGFICRVL